MTFRALTLPAVFLCLILFISCDDDSSGPGRNDDGVFIYGLVETGMIYDNPAEDFHNVFARILNNPDFRNISGQFTHGTETHEMILDQNSYSVSLNDGVVPEEFQTGDIIELTIKDTDNEYSGEMEVVEALDFYDFVKNDNLLTLSWNDNGSDFYDIGLSSYSDYNENYIHEDTTITIDLDETGFEDRTEIFIHVFSYKGFNAFELTGGNIEGCHGYFFSYSRAYLNIDFEAGTSTIPPAPADYKGLDSRILDYAKGKYTRSESYSYSDIDYLFSYAYLVMDGYHGTENQSFIGNILVEPIGVLSEIEAKVNDVEIPVIISKSYNQYVHDYEAFVTNYTTDSQATYQLTLNGVMDEASITLPDTFSVLVHPDLSSIPTEPFEVSWRRPQNSQFFFIEARWLDGTENRYYYHHNLTNDTSYIFDDMPEDLASWYINILAVNGVNPLKSESPNMSKHNGYFYSLRMSANTIIHEGNSPDIIAGNQENVILDDNIVLRMDKVLKEKHTAINNSSNNN